MTNPADHSSSGDDLAGETWRPVPPSGWYLVSNRGRVKSVPRTVRKGGPPPRDGQVLYREVPECILAQSVVRGYFIVSLATPAGRRTHNVHRLVCAAFNGPANHQGAE